MVLVASPRIISFYQKGEMMAFLDSEIFSLEMCEDFAELVRNHPDDFKEQWMPKQ